MSEVMRLIFSILYLNGITIQNCHPRCGSHIAQETVLPILIAVLELGY